MAVSPSDPAENPSQEARLNPRYIFEEFVIGPHNRFPHAAAQAVSDNLGKAYNPLFIYGPVGLGKTHLMQAVGHRVFQKNNQIRVLYVTAEQFMMEVIELLQSGNLKDFREKYRTLDLLLVDDVQFLAASESTQEEFFHTFNELHQSGKQIIMTSDRPPKMLTTLEDRLRSRFEWGLIADIKIPNLETRVAILRKKESQMSGMTLGEDIRLYIAGKLKSNVRELEGFLKRIQAYAQLNNQEINLPMVKEIMRELLPPKDWDEEDQLAAESAAAAIVVKEAPPPPPPVEKRESAPPPAPPARLLIDLPEIPDITAFMSPVPPAPEPPPPPASVVNPVPAALDDDFEDNLITPESLDSGVKSIPVIFFFPAGKETELKKIRQKFEDIIKKHKLKFQLDSSREVSYPVDGTFSSDMLVENCRKERLKIAIVLGPPPESRIQEIEFQQKMQEACDANRLSLQMILWEELAKDYRYLNLALDITLIRFKQKGKK